MSNTDRTQRDSEIPERLLAFAEQELGNEQLRITAGAFMSVSVALCD